MFVKVNSNRAGRRPRYGRPSTSNSDIIAAAWGTQPPHWVIILASACDATNQRIAGERIGKSSGYVSRLISNTYPGDLAEAERLVRAAYGNEDVVCPLWGPIPLASCMRSRRRKGQPHNQVERMHARHCPDCPINTDHAQVTETEED